MYLMVGSSLSTSVYVMVYSNQVVRSPSTLFIWPSVSTGGELYSIEMPLNTGVTCLFMESVVMVTSNWK